MHAEPLREKNDPNGSARLDVRATLKEIAQPRLTGSDGAAITGAAIRAHLESFGYEVEERTFTFSPWPGRFGISAVGALYFVSAFTAAVFLYTNHPFGAIAVLLILLVLVGLGVMFLPSAIDELPFARRRGKNLYAVQPGARPRYIIMAHRDSKSQPVPLAFRGPAIVVALLVWVLMLLGALFHLAKPLPGAIILLLGVLGCAAGVILIFCWVENRSPGALDNASGVVAALAISQRERESGDVAFLITDAEELGLAGARAATRDLPPVIGVINLDGLDDDGVYYVVERFGTFRKKGLAPHLAAALLEEAAARGEPADRRDLAFGIQVDHIPIMKAGTPAVTLMRGTMRSLLRVHRANDDLAHLRGDGVVRCIELVCGALRRLREQVRPLEQAAG